MSKPLFVAISDLHFNLNNLHLSSAALHKAEQKALELKIPLVIAGDLHDTKAIIRAEVANTLVSLLSNPVVDVFILMGNHDMLNEKGEGHGLNYLRPYANVIDFPCKFDELPGVLFIPYQNDSTNISNILKQKANKGDILVMHQGVKGAFMGDYVQDKTSIEPSSLKDFTCISGHYHKHQTVGTLTYIGNPFTMSFGEANDGPKGFLVVNDDGTFTREILPFRKHVILERNLEDSIRPNTSTSADDIIWLKLRGSKSKLDMVSKADLSKIVGHSNFKLDKISSESAPLESSSKNLTDKETLDALIDKLSDMEELKTHLKSLWRELLA